MAQWHNSVSDSHNHCTYTLLGTRELRCMQLQNWRAPKPSATFVHKSQIQLQRYLPIFQLGRRWWWGCSQLCQVYKSKKQNGTTEQLCSSSLPWRVKPPSYENTCVYKLSCRIYVTDALSPTKQLHHINTFSWVHVVASWNPFQELNFTCSVHNYSFYWQNYQDWYDKIEFSIPSVLLTEHQYYQTLIRNWQKFPFGRIRSEVGYKLSPTLRSGKTQSTFTYSAHTTWKREKNPINEI